MHSRFRNLDDAARCLDILAKPDRYPVSIRQQAVRSAPHYVHQAVYGHAEPAELTVTERAAVCAAVVEGRGLSLTARPVSGPPAETRVADLIAECRYFIDRVRTPDAPTAAVVRRTRRIVTAERHVTAYAGLSDRWRAGVIHSLTPVAEIISQRKSGGVPPNPARPERRPCLDRVLADAVRQCEHEARRPAPRTRRTHVPTDPAAALIAHERALIARELADRLDELPHPWQVYAMDRIAAGVTPRDVLGILSLALAEHRHPLPRHAGVNGDLVLTATG